MAIICHECGRVHPYGVVSCEEVKRIDSEFQERVRHHFMHCKGCPDPEQHVRNLDKMNNPSAPVVV